MHDGGLINIQYRLVSTSHFLYSGTSMRNDVKLIVPFSSGNINENQYVKTGLQSQSPYFSSKSNLEVITL